MNHENDPRFLLQSWTNAFKEALDFDTWGQRLEAVDVYESLSKLLKSYSGKNGTSLFTENQEKTLRKIALCLDSRSKALQTDALNPTDDISIHDLRQLDQTLQNLLGDTLSESSENCASLTPATLQHLSLSSKSTLTQTYDNSFHATDSEKLLPRNLSSSGQTMLTVTVEQIALKNASKYLQPFISVSVKDSSGKSLSTTQDTSTVAMKIENSIIVFNSVVHIEKPVESFPPGFAVFFEFKHFKKKKSIVSTKCWAVMESEEISEGALALEIYKKPTDFCRKTLKLLTTKPMYLHLRLSLS